MGRRLSAATMVTVVVAALFALMLATVPAAAHHKDEHLQGKGNGSSSQDDDKGKKSDSDSATSYTEDDDTNDGNTPNNQPDEGDNAHPSGKDKSVENGGSGNQGKSESDPDDDGRGPDRSNGGADKPNGSGGVDKADQDGNNGCGNDDDFEDDNEGWCGRKPKPGHDGNQGGSTPTPSRPGVHADNQGNADMTISVDCYSITVTSSKDISYVAVIFADGTEVKTEGLRGYSFTRTFDEPLAGGRAKSGTTVVSDTVSGECAGTPAPEPTPCDADATMPGTQPCKDELDTGALPTAPCVDEDAMVDGNEQCGPLEEEILAGLISRPATADVEAPAVTETAEVLGERLAQGQPDEGAAERSASFLGQTLPFTGSTLLSLAAIAVGLLLAGAGILTTRGRA